MRVRTFKGALLLMFFITSIVGLAIPLLSSSPVHAAFISHAPIYINGNSGFTSPDPVNGGGSGTASDPYIIENWDISAVSANGIEIQNTTANFIIRNCYVHDGGDYFNGIFFYNVTNGVLDNNIVDNNYWEGICLDTSSNNTISNNIAGNTRNIHGIILDHSDNNLIDNNTLSNNQQCGIQLINSSNNTVYNNIAENNRTGQGILIQNSNNNLIENNTCENNYYQGINLWDNSDNNTISANICSNNYQSGISLSNSSNNNRIYHNNLVNNKNQANDSGSNYWDNGYPFGGNYWSDYAGMDRFHGENKNIAGGEGFGDSPYNISGGGNKDRYPLMQPWPSIIWGTHQIAASNTIELLPGFGWFLLTYSNVIIDYSSKPDLWTYPNEGYTNYYYCDVTHDENDLADGVLPWAVEENFNTFVQCLVDNDWSRAAQLAGVINHYIVNASNPLHATSDYNPGGNKEAFELMVNYQVSIDNVNMDTSEFVPQKLENIFNSTMQLLSESYSFTSVLNPYLSSGILWNDEIKNIIENRLRASVQLQADIWYTAMVLAGKEVWIEPHNSKPDITIDHTLTVNNIGSDEIYKVRLEVPKTSDNHALYQVTSASAPENWISSLISPGPDNYPTVIEWTAKVPGGEIAAGKFTDFEIMAKTPRNEGFYTWTIKTTDVNNYTENSSFATRIDNTSPSSPILVCPSDNENINDKTPDLNWVTTIDPSTPVTYDLTVTYNENFEWWNENWQKRRPITINGSHPENYQIKIVIPYYGGMRTDYGDIRFLENEAAGVLPYWIENYTTDNVTAWVRRMENDDNTIYVYYSNPRATRAENGDATFLFFDDFLGTSLNTNKWEDNTPYASVANSILTYSSTGVGWIDIRSKNLAYSYPFAWMGRFKVENLTTSQAFIGMAKDNTINTIFYPTQSGADNIAAGVGNTKNSDYVRGVYFVGTIAYDGSKVHFYRNGIECSNSPLNYTNATAMSVYLGLYRERFYVEWVALRKFTSPEPTASMGDEESLLTGLTENNYQVTTRLTEGICYWKVRARDNAGNISQWSPARFRVDTTAPSSPALISPANGWNTRDNAPTLKWNPVNDNSLPVTYEVGVDNDADFSSPEISANRITDNNYKITKELAEGVWYWRVRATDNAGNIGANSGVRSFRVDATPPASPILLWPASGENIKDNAPTLKWVTVNENSLPVTYDVWVDNDNDFSSPEASSFGIKDNNYKVTVGLADGIWYWRVRATDNAGNLGENSVVSSFKTPPPVPNLLGPANGTNTVNNILTFRWSAVTNLGSPATYDIEVDNDNDFSSPEKSATGLIDNMYTPSVFTEKKYYWHVRTVDNTGNSSNWSSVWTLRIDTVPPAAPILMWPANGENIKDNAPTLKWNAVSDNSLPMTYEIWVDNDPDFSSPEASAIRVTGNSYKVTVELAEWVWYWRVRATDNAGNVGETSDVRYFVIDIISPPVPSLDEPADGTNTSDNTPTFRWSAVTDSSTSPVTYNIEIDNENDFSSPESSASGLVDNTYTSIPLADENYSWRVCAVDNAGNSSGWSSVWTLRIDTTPPAAPILMWPADGEYVKDDNTPNLKWNPVIENSLPVTYGVRVANYFEDQFTSPTLGPDWSISAGRGNYSLTDNAGYLRYIIDAMHTSRSGESGYDKSLWLVRQFSGDQWILKAAITYNMRPGEPTNNRGMSFWIRTPGENWNFKLIAAVNRSVGVNDNNPGSNVMNLSAGDNSTDIYIPNSSDPLPLERWYFEIERNKDQITVRASNDDNDSTFEYEIENTFAPGLGNDQVIEISGNGWYGSNDPAGYADFDFIKVVSTMPDFSPPEIIANRIMDDNYKVPIGLAEGIWYWYVRATDNAGNVGDSIVRSFRVDTTHPAAPILLSPAEGENTNDNTPNLNWATVIDSSTPVTYDLTITYNQNFEWWNENWQKRRPITISGKHPENYQIKIVIPYYTGMRSDYGDLRFLENENAGLLSYWIENYTADKVTVWVKRMENDDNTIYVYYSNPRATSAENGDATFLFFDHFLGTSLNTSKWQDNTSYASVANSILTYSRMGAGWVDIRSKNLAYSYPFAWMGRFKVENLTASQAIIGMAKDNTINTIFYPTQSGSDNIMAGVGNSKNSDYPQGVYFIGTITYDGSKVHFYTNGVECVNSPLNYTNATALPVYLGLYQGRFYVDWVALRKFTSPEPTASVGGEESFLTGLTQNNYQITTELTEGMCYWEVRARDNAGNIGPWSPARFRVDITAPYSPALSSPADGWNTKDNAPSLRWSAVSENSLPLTYYVLVDNDSNFSSPEISATGVIDNNYKITMELTQGVWYWRVRATDNAGNVGANSSARSFRVDATPPAAPVLAWPVNGGNIKDKSPSFKWNPVIENSLPVAYDLWVDNNPDFSSPEISATGVIDNNYKITMELTQGVWYWRVRATDNAGNVGDNSGTNWFMIDTTPPSAPTPLEPADGISTADNTPAFEWSVATDSSTPVTYDIEIDDGTDFSSPENSATGLTNNAYTPSALADENYSWRVRAVDNAGNPSSWSYVWTLIIDANPPDMPVLVWPAEGENTNDTTPNLEWNAVIDISPPVIYDVQVDSNPDFFSPLVTQSRLISDNYQITTELPEGTWYWRVRATDNMGFVGRSSSSSFKVDITQPITPILVEPAQGAVLTENTPTLDWSDVADNSLPVTYGVQVDNEPDFLSPELDVTGLGVSAATHELANGVWYWRANAKDNAGNSSAWSVSRSFKVDITPPPAPQLLAPADGEITSDNAPPFSWTAMTDDLSMPVTYELQVSNDPDFSSLAIAVEGLIDNTFTPSIAFIDDNYLWRVRAVDNAGNVGLFSPTWTLRIKTKDEYTLKLFAGWNLVSFPLTNVNTTPKNVFRNMNYYTDYYIYHWRVPGGPYDLDDPNQVFEDNIGYWIWINQDKTVITSGERSSLRDVHLTAGWNLLSFAVAGDNTTPNNVFTGLDYYSDYILYYWSAPGGPYNIQDPNTACKDNLGYWIWINQDKIVTVP